MINQKIRGKFCYLFISGECFLPHFHSFLWSVWVVVLCEVRHECSFRFILEVAKQLQNEAIAFADFGPILQRPIQVKARVNQVLT